MSTRRSFLKGLAAAAALALARLLPPLAPENDWGFKDIPDGWYYVRIRYVSLVDGSDYLSPPVPVYGPQQPVAFTPRDHFVSEFVANAKFDTMVILGQDSAA